MTAAGLSGAPTARRAGRSGSPAVIGSVRFPWGRGAAGSRASFRLCWELRGTAEDQAGLCRGKSGPRDPVSGIAGELRDGEGRGEEAGSPSLPPGVGCSVSTELVHGKAPRPGCAVGSSGSAGGERTHTE